MLTRDEIMSMQAGRELDKLVAEFVMGWRKGQLPAGVHIVCCPTVDYYWYSPDKPKEPKCSNDFAHGWIPPQYSTSIADAWQVVEKLQAEPDEYFFGIQMTPAIPHKGAPCWHVELGGKHAHAPTAPLAICRAALMTTIR